MITDIASLKVAAANYMRRTNLSDEDFDTAIQVTDTNIAYGSEGVAPLRVRAMETSTTFTLLDNTAPLPDDYLEFRNIFLNTNPKVQLAYLTPQNMTVFWPDSESGIPVNFTIEGESIIFGPNPDGEYELDMLYYKKFPQLTDAAPTNWVLENRPDIYLFGVMAELEGMLQGPSQDRYISRFARAMASTNSQNVRDRHSGSSLVMRTDTHRRRNPNRTGVYYDD